MMRKNVSLDLKFCCLVCMGKVCKLCVSFGCWVCKIVR